jgi:glycosyltransferase involved in cell wall biosynthesis
LEIYDNPKVSFILLAYNQKEYIREAVVSVLNQTYEPLEIVITDDCSTDGTYEVLQHEISNYCGPHKIILNRNEINLKIAGNLNRAFNLCSGKLIVVQAGDDISSPIRVEKIVKHWLSAKMSIDLICSYFEEIDRYGASTGYIKKEVAFLPDINLKPFYWRCGATGACACYTRKLFEKYGPLDLNVLAEDWVYPFRAWIEAGISVVEEPLVKHRTHENSISLMLRNVNSTKDKKIKTERRLQAAKNELAIANEWLKAWNISGKKGPRDICSELINLVEMRKLQVDAFHANLFDGCIIAVRFILIGGGFINATKIFIRNFLKIL